MNLIYLSNLTPDQIRALEYLCYLGAGLIWSYITYRACNYVIRKEKEKEEYEKKHVPPFVTIRGQNGKQQKRN